MSLHSDVSARYKIDGWNSADRCSFSLGLRTFRRVYQMRTERRTDGKRAVKTHVCTFGLLDSERGYAEISAQVFSESILLSSPLMTPILTTNRATMRYIRAAVKNRLLFLEGPSNFCVYGMREPTKALTRPFPAARRGMLRLQYLECCEGNKEKQQQILETT